MFVFEVRLISKFGLLQKRDIELEGSLLARVFGNMGGMDTLLNTALIYASCPLESLNPIHSSILRTDRNFGAEYRAA